MTKKTTQLIKSLSDHNISLDLWARAEEIRASMAIEGFDMSDDELIKAVLQYQQEGGDAVMANLKKAADAEGIEFNQLIRDYFESIGKQ